MNETQHLQKNLYFVLMLQNNLGVYRHGIYINMKKKIKNFSSSPFTPLSCRLGHRQISIHRLHIPVASRQTQEFISPMTSHAFLLTNPRHSLLSCTIFITSPTFKNLFSSNSPSRYQSIYSAAYPLSDYQHILLHRRC